jgi:hypothetical protein
MVFIICYTNSTRTLEHSYFTSSQLLRQGNSSITIFQSTDDVLSGSFHLVCTQLLNKSQFHVVRESHCKKGLHIISATCFKSMGLQLVATISTTVATIKVVTHGMSRN